MMKKIIIIITIGAWLSLLCMSNQAYIATMTEPDSYLRSSSKEINISGGINTTAFPFLNERAPGENGSYPSITRHTINVTILNKSCASCAYGILESSLSLTINATNDTTLPNFWNFTTSFKEGRNWIRLNFTNISRDDDGTFGGYLTDEVIVDIDTELYLLKLKPFSKINFSLDRGDINISGNLHIGSGGNITMIQGTTRYLCGPNGTGKPMICI